jgi:putative copper resistance protein D
MRELYLLSVFLHVLAAMTWIGGMFVATTAVMPGIRRIEEPHRSHFKWHFFGRLRAVMWTAFAVAGLTGATTLGFRGIRFSNVVDPEWWSSPFGWIVAVKIGLFAASGVLIILHQRTKVAARSRVMAQLTLVLGVAIVLSAVVLVRGR